MSTTLPPSPSAPTDETTPVDPRRRRYALGAGALLLSACGGGGGGFAFSAAPAPAAPSTPAQRALEKLPQLVEELRQRTGVPGVAVAVVHQGQTLFTGGFGVRKKPDTAPVDADTRFQLASVSKSLAATIVARQVSEGVIRWDSPVHPWLPEFVLSNPDSTRAVTVGHLLSHQSGLDDHAGDQLEDLGYDREGVLSRLRWVPVEPLNSRYAYTNFGYTAGAEAAARAAGSDWAELAERTLYRPLGMQRTSSRFADFIADPNHAATHVKVNGDYQALYVRRPDAQSPAGGASSSAADLAQWMKLILAQGQHNGQRLISPQALQPALHPQPNAQAHYGYGFNVGTDPHGRPTYSHSGAFALGAGTVHMLWPEAGLGIAVLTNAQPIGLAESIAASFSELFFDGVISKDWLSFFEPKFAEVLAPFGSLIGQTPPSHPTPSQALNHYVGRYTNHYYGEAQVLLNGTALELRLGTQGQTRHPLRHWEGDQFVFDLQSENATPGSVSWLRFSPASNGLPASFATEYYAQDLAKGRFEQVPD